MFVKKELKYIFIFLCFILLTCTEEVDFDQANDFHVSPVVESSPIFFNESANQFVEEGEGINTIQDDLLINIFNDQFIIDNLTKAEFVFDIVNSIDRSFSLQVEFLNEMDNILHIMTINVAASPSNEKVYQTHIETFEGASLLALKKTQKMSFTLNLTKGSPITKNSLGIIQLKSKAIFYLDIDSSL